MTSHSLPRGLGLLPLLSALTLSFGNWAQYELKPVLSAHPWLPLELLFHLSGAVIAVTSFLAALGYGLLLGLLIPKLLLAVYQIFDVVRVIRLGPKNLRRLIFPTLITFVLFWISFFWSPFIYGPVTVVRLIFIGFGLLIFESFALRYFERRRHSSIDESWYR